MFKGLIIITGVAIFTIAALFLFNVHEWKDHQKVYKVLAPIDMKWHPTLDDSDSQGSGSKKKIAKERNKKGLKPKRLNRKKIVYRKLEIAEGK